MLWVSADRNASEESSQDKALTNQKKLKLKYKFCMFYRTKIVWLIFIIAFSHKVQECVDFSWNFVHSSEPKNPSSKQNMTEEDWQ